MPSRIGAPQLAFAQLTGSFNSGAGVERVLNLRVQDAYFYRKLYVAVLPVEGNWTGFAWTGRLQTLLNEREQDQPWKLGYRQDETALPTGLPALATGEPLITPPYWVETVTSGAYWPVNASVADELTAHYKDTNNAQAYRVHMQPIRTTGHFDTLRLSVNLGYATQVDGENNYLILLGCESRPIA